LKLTIHKTFTFVYVILLCALLMTGCNTPQTVTADRIAHDRAGYIQNPYQGDTNVVQVKGSDTTNLLNEYKVTMQGIGETIEMLRQDKLSTYSAIELIVSGNSQGGYTNAIKIIKERVALQCRLIEDIDYVEGKFASIAKTYPAEWNSQIKRVANDLDEELGFALDDLNNEVDKFSELFDTDRLEIFDYMARDKTELLAVVRKQNITIDPDIPLFKQMKASVRLGMNVDKTQLVFLEYAVCVLDMQRERLEIEKTMGELDMVSYLDIRLDKILIFEVFVRTQLSSLALAINAPEDIITIMGSLYYEGYFFSLIVDPSPSPVRPDPNLEYTGSKGR